MFDGMGFFSVARHVLQCQVWSDFLWSLELQFLHRTPFFSISGFIFMRLHRESGVKLLFIFFSWLAIWLNCWAVIIDDPLFSFWMNNGSCLAKKIWRFFGASSMIVFWDGNTSA